jgi:60 kDa SS-A/Ro ribonucleoprotein
MGIGEDNGYLLLIKTVINSSIPFFLWRCCMKVNIPNKVPSPRTHEGSIASWISKTEELKRTVMACLLFEDNFYEAGESVADRIWSLVQQIPAKDVITIMKQASKEYKLRHAPLLLAVSLLNAERDRGVKTSTAEDIAEVINRADSITEILALYWKDGKKPLSHTLKNALVIALRKQNEYSFAKYDRDGAIKLRDVFRIARPKPENPEQSALWKRVVTRTLEIPNTWEVQLSAGKDKKEVFSKLIQENQLGDLAFLRNLRNMISFGVDRDVIVDSFTKRSFAKILPYQFIAAAKYAPIYEQYLDKAMCNSLQDMEKIEGRTALLIDVSGSMNDTLSSKSELTRWDAAVSLGMLLEGVCSNLRAFVFNDEAKEIAVRPGFGFATSVPIPRGGTQMFNALKQVGIEYDRVIGITDEQTSDNGTLPDCACKYYIMNVGTNENGVAYNKNCVHISGFSEASIRYITEYEKK